MAPTDNGPWGTSRPTTRSRVVELLRDRVLVQAGTYGLKVTPPIDPQLGGLWISAANAIDKAREHRSQVDGPLVIDTEPYGPRGKFADATTVFETDTTTLLGTLGLDEELRQQRRAGADLAVTPTRYLGSGNQKAFVALARQANSLDRDDTLVLIPADVSWVSDTHIDAFIELLNEIEPPKAIMLGHAGDPLRDHPMATRNLRKIEASVPQVMRARTDLSALDGVAHGAFAGTIGLRESHRHLVPPGSRSFISNPSDRSPSVLDPDLMTFHHGKYLQRLFPGLERRCGKCRARGEHSLLHYLREQDRLDVNEHNIAVWNDWLADLRELTPGKARVGWWSNLCRTAATLNHEIWDRHSTEPLEPTPALKIWAGMRD